MIVYTVPVADEDYIAVNKSVIFYPGYDRLQCVHIPILNDECLEESKEIFNVSLSSRDSYVVVDGPSEVEVYIWDDDGMFTECTVIAMLFSSYSFPYKTDILVGFSEEVSVVDESVDNVTVCVQVCEGDLKRNAEISLDFENGTAQCK